MGFLFARVVVISTRDDLKLQVAEGTINDINSDQ